MLELIAWMGTLAIGTKIMLGIVVIGAGLVLAAGCRYFLHEQTRFARPRENRRLTKEEAKQLIERHLRGARRRLRIVR